MAEGKNILFRTERDQEQSSPLLYYVKARWTYLFSRLGDGSTPFNKHSNKSNRDLQLHLFDFNQGVVVVVKLASVERQIHHSQWLASIIDALRSGSGWLVGWLGLHGRASQMIGIITFAAVSNVIASALHSDIYVCTFHCLFRSMCTANHIGIIWNITSGQDWDQDAAILSKKENNFCS